MSIDIADIQVDDPPYYVALDEGTYTAYVLSGPVNKFTYQPDLSSASITPITYESNARFQAGPTVFLNTGISAIAADPRGHLLYAGTQFGALIPRRDFGVEIYNPADNFRQCGFIPLPIPNLYDYTGLKTRQVAIHADRLFVGVDNEEPKRGASGLVYIIENFASKPIITMIENIEPTGEGICNFSFFENRLYFVNYNSRNLICIDIDRKMVLFVVDISDGIPLTTADGLPSATAISRSKREIYIARSNHGLKTMDVSGEWPVPIGNISLRTNYLNSIAVDDSLNLLHGAGFNSGFLTMVDTAADREITKSIKMAGAIPHIAVDEDNHRIYVANATQKKYTAAPTGPTPPENSDRSTAG